MNIVLCFDDSYSSHAAVVIESFCENNKGVNTFYILTNYLSYDNEVRLNFIVKKFGCIIKAYLVDVVRMKDFPIGKGTANTYVSIATYFRLFITEYIPKEVTKVIYLDCDVVVNGDLSSLWNHKFEKGKCIFALEENPQLGYAGCVRLGYPASESYFNAGVLLIDLNEMRKHYTLNEAIEYIRTHKILFHDQDVLNGMLYNRKEFMPLKYNVMDSFYIKNFIYAKRYRNELNESIHNAVIIHYSGPIKPWHKECKNPMRYLYDKYLKATPYATTDKEYKYKSLKEKTIYHIKNVIKWTLERLHIRYYSFIALSK